MSSADDTDITEIDSEDEIDPQLRAEIVIEDNDDEIALLKRRNNSKVFNFSPIYRGSL